MTPYEKMLSQDVEAMEKYAIAGLIDRAELRELLPHLNRAFDVIDYCEAKVRIKLSNDLSENFAEMHKIIEKISKL